MCIFRTLVRNLPCSTHSKEIFDGFNRYEEQRENDDAAKLTKNLDKFDMILQAFEYEFAQGGRGNKKRDFLQEFFTSTEGIIDHPVVKKWDVFLSKSNFHLLSFNFGLYDIMQKLCLCMFEGRARSEHLATEANKEKSQ